MKEFEKRYCLIGNRGVSKIEFEEIFTTIIDTFSQEWLEEKPINPIQILWQRKNDIMANLELLSLGYSMKKLNDIDSGWLKKQIKKIKDNNVNNQRGFMFEILGIAALHNSNNNAHPMKDSAKLFDCFLEFDNQYIMNISMKSFGKSLYQTNFEKDMTHLNQEIYALFIDYEKNALSLNIEFFLPHNKQDIADIMGGG